MPGRTRGLAWRFGAVTSAALLSLAVAAPAFAAQGSIDHVESQAAGLQVLYSLPGITGSTQADLSTLKVTLNGKPVPASAKSASTQNAVRRTTILAFDVSDSMGKNNKFVEAKRAANVFLAHAPADVYVGIVTFAGGVKVAQAPTLDRGASKQVVAGLSLSFGTRLYDGVRQAVATSGTTGERSVLVLSDGADTTNQPITTVESAIKTTKTQVDVVALAQSAADKALLHGMASAGNGQVYSAQNPASLSGVFASEAQTLAKQLLVTVKPPASMQGKEGTLAVSVDAGGTTYTDSAFVSVGKLSSPKTTPPKISPATNLRPVPQPLLHVSRSLMLGGLGAAAVGLLVLLLLVLGVFRDNQKASVESRIAAYTRRGSRKLGKGPPQGQQQGVHAQAVGIAQKALDSTGGLETKVSKRLEAAGMSIKAAEWLLLHAGIMLAAAVIGFLLGSGSILFGVVGLAAGALLPWFYLGFKQGRRLKGFKGQLADTLQLMSGSLSAGMSLAQSVDTVVREGVDPIAAEFRRAIVEARLGVEMEDALEAIAARMESRDFEWVVMAIRIQREVGGNLAELLNTVAGTIREREYLERQVLSLSAEGRLSVWILGGLPPGFMGYLLLANPTYLHPLISSLIGFIALGVMAVLLTVGIFWMKKLVKVDV